MGTIEQKRARSLGNYVGDLRPASIEAEQAYTARRRPWRSIMSDNHLVKRLRDFAGSFFEQDVDLINEAADRIEALEEKLGKEFLGKAGWRKVADRLQNRVWALETALREIADWHNRGASYGDDWSVMADIARRGLQANHDQQSQPTRVVAPRGIEAN